MKAKYKIRKNWFFKGYTLTLKSTTQKRKFEFVSKDDARDFLNYLGVR